ncbi:cytochrome P450 [Rhizophagus diaphanus]|nr:cytochrome P450 [Rhizophagus diaphanus] [Rhizophagus sp. MUCL 43196]
MELPTFLFTLFFAAIIYVFFNNQRKKSKIPNGCIPLPGPTPLPIIGNLHQINNVPIQDFIDKFSNEYGPIFQVHYGAETWVILNDYEIVKDVLVKRSAIYSSRPYNDATTRVYFDGGKSIGFSPYGKYWRAMRAVSHQALTQKMVNINYRDIIHTEVKNLMIKFYNRSSESYNPTNDLRFFLINLFTTILFGQKSEKLSLQIEQMISEIAHILRPENGTIDKFPWLKYIPFVEKRLNRHAYKARDLARELFKHLLEDLRQKLKENENENSFAAHVLKNMNISSDIALLANYPEVQRKIQKELDECLQGNRFQTPQDDLKLPYLWATIKESLRCRTGSSTLMKHSTTKDDVYRGYYIPAKATIMMSYKSAHTSEKLFERPNEFYPEHYLDENGQLKKYDDLRDPWTFGRGRRACVGQHLAERNLITTVGYALTLFNVENDYDSITGNPIKLDLKRVDKRQPYKVRFVPRPGVTLEKIMQMN